jgi:hypothetical protein
MINDFRNAGVSINLMRPTDLINHIDERLGGKNNNKEYDAEKYLYEQLTVSKNNQIDQNSNFWLADRKIQVFYTKQYPNIYTNKIDNPIGLFIKEINDIEINFVYSLCINLGTSKAESEIHEFSTSFSFIDCEDELVADVAAHFKRQYSWLIYPNLLFPFQQFFDSIPFQYDFEAAKRQSKYSTTQKFPINKIIELIPMESSDVK